VAAAKGDVMAGTCGTCVACCKVFAIAELAKPVGQWCKHCSIGKGCRIYEKRPEPCVTFKCLWLESQTTEFPFAADLRPDKCKVVISPTTNPKVLTAITMTGSPDAWRREPVARILKLLVRGGHAVAIGPAGSTRKTMLEQDANGVLVISEARLTAADANGMQWSVE
jgi:hypothetical protein